MKSEYLELMVVAAFLALLLAVHTSITWLVSSTEVDSQGLPITAEQRESVGR